MRILIVNDDGIQAEGIRRLAVAAARFGEIILVAPEDQCSAMSHRITLRKNMTARPVPYTLEHGVSEEYRSRFPLENTSGTRTGTLPPVAGSVLATSGTPAPAAGTHAPVPESTDLAAGTHAPVPESTALVAGTHAPVPESTASAGGTPAPVPESTTAESARTVTAGGSSTQVTAWSVSGTPADCVKVALGYICRDKKPDIVFSGMNFGWNIGHDIAYSGTVGAAMEARMAGLPAIAWSCQGNGEFGTADAYLLPIMEDLLAKLADLPTGEIWNVNFPGVPAAECRGILRDRTICQIPPFEDRYRSEEQEDGSVVLAECSSRKWEADPGSDMDAVYQNYVSIGNVHSMVM